MAGSALARDNAASNEILHNTLRISVQVLPPAQLLFAAAAECKEAAGGPGSPLSTAAQDLVWLMESVGKAAVCASSRLRMQMEVVQQQEQQPQQQRGEESQRREEEQQVGRRRTGAAGSARSRKRGGASGGDNTAANGPGLHRERRDGTHDQGPQLQLLRREYEAADRWAMVLIEVVAQLLLALCGPASWLAGWPRPPFYLAGCTVGAEAAAGAGAGAAATGSSVLCARLCGTDQAALRGAAAYCAAALCRIATCKLEAGGVLGPTGAIPGCVERLPYACELLVFPLCDWVPSRQLLFRADPLRLLAAGLQRLLWDLGLTAGARSSGQVGQGVEKGAAHSAARLLGALACLGACGETAPHVAAWLAEPAGARWGLTADGGEAGEAQGRAEGSSKEEGGEGQVGGGACGSREVVSRGDAVVLVAACVDRERGGQWWAAWAGRLVGAAPAAAGGGGAGAGAGAGEAGGSKGAEALREAAAALVAEWHEELWGVEARGAAWGEPVGTGAGGRGLPGAPAEGLAGGDTAGGDARGSASCEGKVEEAGEAAAGGVQEVAVAWPRVCANEMCLSFAGERDARLGLQRCGRCEARYCCRECQAAHWRAGHKRECGTVGG